MGPHLLVCNSSAGAEQPPQGQPQEPESTKAGGECQEVVAHERLDLYQPFVRVSCGGTCRCRRRDGQEDSDNQCDADDDCCVQYLKETELRLPTSTAATYGYASCVGEKQELQPEQQAEVLQAPECGHAIATEVGVKVNRPIETRGSRDAAKCPIVFVAG